MILKPAEYRLVTFGKGMVASLPLWERIGTWDCYSAKFVWVKLGIWSEKPIAGLTSAIGNVPCVFADPAMMLNGCPVDGIRAIERDCKGVLREVIIQAPDGILEPATILVVDEMRIVP